jgi:Rod binding domain-containing protein
MIPLKTGSSPLPVQHKQQVLNESEQRRLKLKKTTQAFEAIFISQLMKSMRSTSFTKDEEGFGKDIMLSMADESVSQQLAKKGMLGVGKLLYEHLAKRLEIAPEPQSTPTAGKASNATATEKIPIETPCAEPPRQLKVAKPEAIEVTTSPNAPLMPKVDTELQPPSAKAASDEAAMRPDGETSALNKYIEHIRTAAAETNLPEDLLMSMILHESGGNAQAVSRKGAAGLMQLMPDTARAMGVNDRFDPKESIMGGAKYLRSLVDRFGDLKTALAAYNAGPTSVTQNAGKVPSAETGKYVESILSDLSKSK